MGPVELAAKIAFVTFRDDNHDIYVMNADGSNPTNLTSGSGAGSDSGWSPYNDRAPSWSPDRTKMVFESFFYPWDDNTEIFVMNVDGSSLVALTNFVRIPVSPGPNLIAYSGDPAWSPDGTKIAFVSNYDESNFRLKVYVMAADGTNLIKLTGDPPATDSAPAWSPDGTKIAFTTDRDGNQEVYVMAADGGAPVNLTHHPAQDSAPAWSPL